MKFMLSALLSLFIACMYGQTTTYKYITEGDLDQYTYTEHVIDSSGCVKGEKSDSTILIKIGAVDPASTVQEKQNRIHQIDKEIAGLESYGKCTTTQIIILQLGEGLFITDSDHLKMDSKKYAAKGYLLNETRFKERYQSKIEKWLPGKTVVFADWGW